MSLVLEHELSVVRNIHDESKGSAGARTIATIATERGTPLSHYRARKLMLRQVIHVNEVERQAKAKGLNPEQRKGLRLEKASPLLETLFAWVKKFLTTAVPQSKLANGLAYIHEREQQLSNYLLDGCLEIDNNGI